MQYQQRGTRSQYLRSGVQLKWRADDPPTDQCDLLAEPELRFVLKHAPKKRCCIEVAGKPESDNGTDPEPTARLRC